ncbi:hypothetical protein V1281_004236 [Nitrobacteraceae bacterium AZCC 2161]
MQLELLPDFQSPNCNRVRANNAPPEPDADGFFEITGVMEIARRRGCTARGNGELVAYVSRGADVATLTAIAPGLWDPVAILRACSEACGRKHYAVDRGTARPTQMINRLDEFKIADLVGADGLRPYLTRMSVHTRAAVEENPEGFFIQPAAVRTARYPGLHRRLEPGNPTWNFRKVLWAEFDYPDGRHGVSYEWRRAMRALEDVGLVTVKLGPRGGMSDAKITWTERAYHSEPGSTRTTLTHDEELFFDRLALDGLV